jgi:hypothetical protein
MCVIVFVYVELCAFHLGHSPAFLLCQLCVVALENPINPNLMLCGIMLA